MILNVKNMVETTYVINRRLKVGIQKHIIHECK